MKKTILSLAFAACAFAASAQENMMSKRGTSILPEVGDYAVGFDAAPFFNYLGNMFNNSADNSLQTNYLVPYTITGLYVYAPNAAYRGMVRIGMGSKKTETIVPLTYNNKLYTTNSVKDAATNVTLGAGMQKTLGKHRVHANYGADAMIMFGSAKSTNTYGEALSDSTNNNGPRVTETKQGGTFGIGVRGFVAIEYFFAPKISVSASYGWGISLISQGKGKTTSEDLDPTSSNPNNVTSTTVETGKKSSFGLGSSMQPIGNVNPSTFGIDNASGIIALNSYF